jgi:hypothetical protein
MSNVDMILSRLQKVRATGKDRWIACCPAHDDKTPSMTVRDDNGKILIHCFAECDTASILDAIGVSFEDLFPGPLERSAPTRRPFPAADVLECLSEESKIVYVIADRMVKGLPIAESDKSRLRTAVARIEAAREIANG